MSDELNDLKDALDAYETKEKKTNTQTNYLGHRTNKAFYVIIVLLLILNIFLVIAHFKTVSELEKRHDNTLSELAEAKLDRDEYKQAYQIVLADAQAFSRIYDVTYGENESGLPSPQRDQGFVRSQVQVLSSTDAWGFYAERGMISDACITTTKLVQTSTDEVEITIVARADETTPLRVLVDAQEIARIDITDSDEPQSAGVKLPLGTHYVDFVHSSADVNGEITVDLVRIGDRTIGTDISIIDYGVGFGFFDCEDTDQGNTIERNGAMRFRIEKA